MNCENFTFPVHISLSPLFDRYSNGILILKSIFHFSKNMRRQSHLKNKKNFYHILLGFLFGISIMMFAFGIHTTLLTPEPITPKPTGTFSANTSSITSLSQQAKATSYSKQTTKNTETSWSSDTIYTGGEIVHYKNGRYRAKWWTQNEIPDKTKEWGVWEYLGKVSSSGTSSDKNTTQKPSTKNSTSSNKDTTTTKNFKVVAYYPSWVENGLSKLRFDTITHVNYAFAIPTSDGSLRPLENPELAKKVIKKAHENGAKALLAIGGWSYNGTPLESTFKSATATKAKRKKFVNSIIAMMEKYGFDGVDMDWEHPRMDDSSKKQYEAVMVSLSKKLHAKNKLLTSAVLSGATPDGQIYYDAAAHTDTVLKAVDWINVMAYDGGDGARHSSYQFAINSGKYWKNTRKMPASKVVLGLPFYGRPSWSSYEQLLQVDKNAYKKNIVQINGMTAYYNGMPLIKKKTKYAIENLGGVMIWEITQDTTVKKYSLLTAVQKAIDEKKTK